MKELQNLTSLNNKKLLVVLPINKLEDVLLSECAYSLAQSKYPIDVLVLTNGLNQDDTDAVKSIVENPTIRLTSKDEQGVLKQEIISSDKKINFVIENTNSINFPAIFNDAFNYAIINQYQNFSLIEPDDLIDNSWYQNFDLYSVEKPDYDGYVPLMREVSNGGFIGFFNEASWFEGLAEVAGVFDLQLLLRFSCINLTGAVFKVESLKKYSVQIGSDGKVVEQGGTYKPMKESVKISYTYELFLRMIYNDLKFYTIPRIGYEHRIDRLVDTINTFSSKIPKDIINKPVEKGGMSQEEYKFWSDLAKKEYFFDEDRNIQFKKELIVS